MSDESNVLSVKILGKVYKIRCPQDQAKALNNAAEFLDSEMRKMRSSSTTPNTERLAVVTALNIANELVSMKQQKVTALDRITERVQHLHDRVKNALADKELAEV